MNVTYKQNASSALDIEKHFSLCDADFFSELAARVDVGNYSRKLAEKSTRLEAWTENRLIGLVAFYQTQGNTFFISNVSVDKKNRHKGIGKRLVSQCIACAEKKGVSVLDLELSAQNRYAERFYVHMGFSVQQKNPDFIVMRRNICTTPFQWEKHGLIFCPAASEKRPWMHEYAQAPATLIFDNFVRVYFSCRPRPDTNGQFVSYCTFVDLDRKDLHRVITLAENPILPLGNRGCFDEFGTYPVSVVRHNGTVLAYYGGWTRCVSVPFAVSIGLAVSSNGGHSFEKAGSGPVLSFSQYEPYVISGPKIRKFNNQLVLFYIAARQWVIADGKKEFSSKIKVAFSEDGITWRKHGHDILPDSLGRDESQASPDVLFCNGKYHMFFCYWDPHTFRKTGRRRIGYASSPDLVHWTRNDALAGLNISTEAGAFDNNMTAYPHVFELDGKIYMLYLGNDVGRQGFALAELNGDLY